MHILAELFERYAFGLQRFCQRHAVAITFADAVLHQLVEITVRHVITFRIELAQNQSSLDEQLKAVREHVVELLLELRRITGVLPSQRVQGGHCKILHLLARNSLVADDGDNAVNQLRAHLRGSTKCKKKKCEAK